MARRRSIVLHSYRRLGLISPPPRSVGRSVRPWPLGNTAAITVRKRTNRRRHRVKLDRALAQRRKRGQTRHSAMKRLHSVRFRVRRWWWKSPRDVRALGGVGHGVHGRIAVKTWRHVMSVTLTDKWSGERGQRTKGTAAPLPRSSRGSARERVDAPTGGPDVGVGAPRGGPRPRSLAHLDREHHLPSLADTSMFGLGSSMEPPLMDV